MIFQHLQIFGQLEVGKLAEHETNNRSRELVFVSSFSAFMFVNEHLLGAGPTHGADGSGTVC